MRHFYPQTIEMTPVERQEAEHRAISQEEQVYRFMKIMGLGWTAWQLKEAPGFDNFEITSLRRCLHNLEKQGRISHCGWVKGPKGVRVGKYVVYTGTLF